MKIRRTATGMPLSIFLPSGDAVLGSYHAAVDGDHLPGDIRGVVRVNDRRYRAIL